MILAFVSPFSGAGAKVVWAGVTYVLLCFAYTVTNMSYGSLAGVMTTDSNERLTLNWIRNLGSQVAQFVLNVVTPLLLVVFVASEAARDKGGDARSYLITMTIYALVALPMFLYTGFQVRERITMTSEQQKVPFSQTVKAVVTNSQLMVVFLTLLLTLVGLFGRIGVMIYYCTYILGNPLLMISVMTAFSVGSTVGGIVFPPLALKFGKRVMFGVSVFSAGVILVVFFLVGASRGMTVLYVLQFLYGLAGFGGPIALSMVPDAVDYYEDKTGIRADGTSYAAVSLSTKIASAVGGAVTLYIMGFFGYDGAAESQTAQTLTGINIATNLMPAIMAFAAIIPLLFWKLSTQRMNEIAAGLEIKRAAQAQALARGASREEAEAVAERAAEDELR